MASFLAPEEAAEAEEEDDVPVPVSVAVRLRPPRDLTEVGRCVVASKNEVTVVNGCNEKFKFDHVFSEAADQASVYEAALRPFLFLLFDGYDLAVILHGASECGKSHTLSGPPGLKCPGLSEADFGLLQRLTRDIFEEKAVLEAAASSEKKEVTIKVSCMDIYNEDVRDLLADTRGRSVSLEAGPDGKVGLRGLTEVECGSVSEVLSCYEASMAVHKLKDDLSFRLSGLGVHNVFEVGLHLRSEGLYKKSKVRFVELASSDRIFVQQGSRNAGGGPGMLPPFLRLGEVAEVNLGLLSLGNVVSALGDPRRNVSHIPHEDSLLTRLLEDAFGGRSLTLLVVGLSSSLKDSEESLNSLMFASRASNIKNQPQPHVEVLEFEDEDSELCDIESEARRDSDLSQLRSASSNMGRMPDLLNNDVSEAALRSQLMALAAMQQHPLPPLHPVQQLLQQQLLVQQQQQVDMLNNYLQQQIWMSQQPQQPQRLASQSPFVPITQRSTPLEPVSPLSQKSPLSVQMYLQPPESTAIPLNLTSEEAATEEPQEAKKANSERRSSLTAQKKLASIVEESDENESFIPSLSETSTEASEDGEASIEDGEATIEDGEASVEEFDSDCSICSDIEQAPQLMEMMDLFERDTNSLVLEAEKGYLENLASNSLEEAFSKRLNLGDPKEAEEEIRQLRAKSTKSDLEEAGTVLEQVHNQLKALKDSIRVKDSLVKDLVQSSSEIKLARKQFQNKLTLLNQESASTRKGLRSAQRSLRLAEAGRSRKDEARRKIEDYRSTLIDLQKNIDSTEKCLSILTQEASEADGISDSLKNLQAQQFEIEMRLAHEQEKKLQLEAEVEHDQLRILELESQLMAQEEQVQLSLKLSQDLEQQKVWLQQEERKLEAAKLETQLLHQRLHEQQKALDLKERSGTDSSGELRHSFHSKIKSSPLKDEKIKNVRHRIAELREYKDKIRLERLHLEHLKEHIKPEPHSCRHCREAAPKGRLQVGPETFTQDQEMRLIEIDVFCEAIDVAIDHKNATLSQQHSPEMSAVKDEEEQDFLMCQLSSLSGSEAKNLLHNFVHRTIDLRCQGRIRDREMASMTGQIQDCHKYIQYQVHCLTMAKIEAKQRLDIQKREYLRKIDLLARCQANDLSAYAGGDALTVDAYEKKVRQLKDDLRKERERSQLYKRFYRENKHKFSQDEAANQVGEAAKAKGPDDQAAALEKFQRRVQKEIQKVDNNKVIRDGKKLIIEQPNNNNSSAANSLDAKSRTKRK